MISQSSTIGFIGLGAMGQLMARRLLRYRRITNRPWNLGDWRMDVGRNG
jgi:3-hydroxyisobutyrate dehydrogenase-like beta-hydroxyacid dehydrogenase